MRCHGLLLLCIHLGAVIIPSEELTASLPMAPTAVSGSCCSAVIFPLSCQHCLQPGLSISLFSAIADSFWLLVGQLKSEAKGCSLIEVLLPRVQHRLCTNYWEKTHLLYAGMFLPPLQTTEVQPITAGQMVLNEL